MYCGSRKGKCDKRSPKVSNALYRYGTVDCAEVGRERLNDKGPAKNTLPFCLKSE